jgi:hypothetical protein
MQQISTHLRDAPVALQQARTAANGMSQLGSTDPEVLRMIINNGVQAQSAGAQMSAAYDLSNQKEAGLTHPDLSENRDLANTAMDQGTLAMLRAQDKLYQMGLDPTTMSSYINKIPTFDEYLRYFMPANVNPDGSLVPGGDPFGLDPMYHPQNYYQGPSLSGEGEGYYFPTVDPKYASIISGAQPGHYEEALRQLYDLASPTQGFLQGPRTSLLMAPQTQPVVGAPAPTTTSGTSRFTPVSS